MPYHEYPPAVKVIVDTLATARGQAYVRAFKALFSHKPTEAALLADWDALRERNGGIKIINIFELAARYQINFKLMCEWLEDLRRPDGTRTGLLPSGFREHYIVGNKNFKVSEELEKAHRQIQSEGTEVSA